MDKLQMCRICLADNVQMYVVVNKTLHDLYEKLTDNTFVTEDCRPILACFICCAQLKKFCRFQKKFLEGEEQFAKIMNEEYERKTLKNQEQFEFFHGFTRTPIKIISIVDVDQTESIVVKEELPADWERLEDVIVPKEECESNDEVKTFNVYNNYLDVEISPLRHSESDSEDDVPLITVKIEELDEQELSKSKREYKETDRVHIVKPNLGTSKSAVPITTEKKDISLKIIQDSQDRSKVQNNISISTVDINCSTNSNEKVSVVKDSKPYKCDMCPKSYSRNTSLKCHILVHTGEKPFKCDICQCSYRAKEYLNRHMLTHNSEKPFKCDVCQSSFIHKFKLTKHLLKHTGEKPFQCEICQRRFGDKSILRRHNRIHTDERPYKCNICQSRFRQLGSLTDHILIHTGEKPYQCNLCPFKCRQKNSLTLHNRRKHTGEKPYECDLCQYKCTNKHDLIKHNRVHTCEKPHKCDICPSSFSQISHLQRHKHVHTGH